LGKAFSGTGEQGDDADLMAWTQAPQDSEAVQAREHVIQNQQVRLKRMAQLDRLQAGAGLPQEGEVWLHLQ
jgi:hypothetical protein